MYYDKQIRYIDYLENGEKQRNCGYVKMTVTDNRLLLEMQIKGLYETDDVASEVVLEGAGTERRIGTILIRQGSGSFRWETGDTAHAGEKFALGEGLRYGQLERIRVLLSPRRSLRCVWREVITRQEPVMQGIGDAVQADGFGERNPVKQTAAREFEEDSATVQGMEPGSVKLGQENGAWVIDSAMLRQEEEKKTGESNGSGLPVISSEPEPMKNVEEPEVYDLKASAPGTTDMEGNRTGKGVTENAAEWDGEEENQIGRGPVNNSRMPEADNAGGAMENPAEDVGQRGTGKGTGGEAVSGTETQNVFQNGLRGDEKNAMEMAELRRDVYPGANEKMEAAAGDSRTQMLQKGDRPRAAVPDGRSQLPEGNPQTQTAPESRQPPQPPHMASMCEDKWQQLQKIYPHIRPFQDEREYLSLRPEDFVILHSDAYQLVQNSFLLHGYFNYDHLILTQVSQRNGSRFYIGVPGNFYEKEKQVAIMYGFGSFECKQEPAQEGDFGYYMIKVEL